MKGITVVDVGKNPEQTTFGTCELCFSYGVADNPYIVLELPDGTTHEVNTFMWDWGDYDEYRVDNIVDFSAWLSEQEFTEADIELIKGGWATPLLCELIDNYYWSRK